MNSTLDIQRQDLAGGHVTTVRLNRPERRNAFDADVITELTATFQALAQEDGLRAVVLGAHGKAFCAGADLNWMRAMADYSWDENRADGARLADLLWTLATCPVPLIGQVQGDCYGGGVGLAATCDIVVAAHEAVFSLSEVKLGLIPATISPYVIRAIGERNARRYFTTAERFDAATAQRLGLVHEVCAAEELPGKVDALVQAVAANGPQAVRASKRLIHDIADLPIEPALSERTATIIADVRASDEGREGMRAFLDKRAPAWQSKA